jgi:hypothetical protein
MVRVPAGSPISIIDRTFTRIFLFEPKKSTTKTVKHFYQNPVCLAKEYKKMIDIAEVKDQSELNNKIGVSRVQVIKPHDLNFYLLY